MTSRVDYPTAICPACHERDQVVGIVVPDVSAKALIWHCRACDLDWHRYSPGMALHEAAGQWVTKNGLGNFYRRGWGI